MDILADENFPRVVVVALREAGHDVKWIHMLSPGIKDSEVLQLAVDESRLLVTFDKDFGELAYRSELPASCGIILFRLPMRSPDYIAQTVVKAVDSRQDWKGYFSVVEIDTVRMRPLPDTD
jgi:predicted nuclease of predicted toxin-antitoxin system